MKISSSTESLQTLVNKIKRGKIIFKHKLQRPEGVWGRMARSLLIDSLLRGYPVNPVYMVIDEVQAVIDGVQRLSTCYSFSQDGFALSKNLEPIKIDGNNYEIAGKKFSKLDDAVKDELMSAQIQVYKITEYTDKEVREMFRRLNAGKALNSVQQLTPDMSDELSGAVFDITSSPLFDKVLTPSQLKSSVDWTIAIEVLMLSEMSNEYDFGSFSRNDKIKFVQYYNDKVNEEKIGIIKQALGKLDEAFDENVKIPKTSLSFICYSCYRVIKDKKSVSKFIEIVNDFLANYDQNEEYKTTLNDGTTSSNSVKFRLNYWRNIIRTM